LHAKLSKPVTRLDPNRDSGASLEDHETDLISLFLFRIKHFLVPAEA
jgi:hypothetical protein